MNYITLGFSTKHGSILSYLTRFFGRWKHSHVVLISEDGHELIESTDQGGVRIMPITYLLGRDDVEIRKVFHPAPGKVWLHASTQIGKPYDEGYSWGWLFHRDWQDANQWSCTELIEWASRLAGYAIFPDDMGYITPRDFYLISQEI